MSESTKETSDRGTTPAGEPRAAQAAGSPAARKVVEGSIWTTGVLLVVALVGLINYLGMKYYHRFDWTGSKLYSLSEKTLSVVSGKLAKQSPDAMKVKTPAAVLGVRGTEFLVRTGAPKD